MPQMPSGTLSSLAWQHSSADPHSNWDEDRVVDWLKSINCAQYVDLFRSMSFIYSPACLHHAD